MLCLAWVSGGLADAVVGLDWEAGGGDASSGGADAVAGTGCGAGVRVGGGEREPD